jgi:hypothetical protein
MDIHFHFHNYVPLPKFKFYFRLYMKYVYVTGCPVNFNLSTGCTWNDEHIFAAKSPTEENDLDVMIQTGIRDSLRFSTGLPPIMIMIFRDFLQSPGKYCDSASIRQLSFSFKSFPIHPSPVILPYDAISSQVLRRLYVSPESKQYWAILSEERDLRPNQSKRENAYSVQELALRNSLTFMCYSRKGYKFDTQYG